MAKGDFVPPRVSTHKVEPARERLASGVNAQLWFRTGCEGASEATGAVAGQRVPAEYKKRRESVCRGRAD